MTTLSVYSPFDGHLIREIPRATEQQAFAAYDAAEKVFADPAQWLSAEKRIAILEKAYELFKKNRDEFARQAAEEGGKPLIDSLIEADRAIQGIKVAIEHIPQLLGKEIPMGITASSAKRMAYTFRQPRGIVMAISAFNHPLNLIVHQVIPAIAVGCPVIVKPASSTPLSCLNVVKILHQAGLPEAWCQAVLCENSVAEKLLMDSRTSFLSFIGSGRVGWHLRSKLAPGATCALEHGGAAPVILTADADLEDAMPLLLKGGFYHAGQVCVSVQRVFIDESICESFTEKFAQLATKLVVGDPVDVKTEVGPLISEAEVDRVAQWVDEAVRGGAKLLCGGRKISNTCYQPTVLLNPPADAKVTNLEIFGPVVCFYSYRDLTDAIARANQVPFAFQSSVFSKNIDTALRCVKALQANAVMVNDHTAFRVDWMPFGGRKDSGLGLGGIPYSMEDMTYEKLMVIRSPVL